MHTLGSQIVYCNCLMHIIACQMCLTMYIMFCEYGFFFLGKRIAKVREELQTEMDKLSEG